MYYTNDTIIYFDNSFINASDGRLDLYSQSLHYGYAVFEGIRSYSIGDDPKIFKAKEHFERLTYSAAMMQIPFDYTVQELTNLSYELLAKNHLTEAYLRPLVVCSPNMSLSKGRESILVIQAWDWTNGYLPNKLRVMTSPFRRPNPNGFHVEAKVSGHYVNSILACQDAKDKGFDEALLLDQDGFVAEGPGVNIFYELDGVLFTPPRGNILPGITRATVMELCNEMGIPVKEIFFTPEQMKGADAGFFCGTAAEIVQLASLDGVCFKLNWEDSVSSRIQKQYQNLVLEKKINEGVE
ncbi:MAG TPA: aminotransferase class IV [Chitinophagaceae bacterium]|nr:aminotransferase class IV [Chitinophagaceae bacterium]